MKRLPLVLTLVALVALAASIAYWILQLFQPPQHTITAAPIVAAPEPSMDAAATLFGGQAAAAVATNFQLTGVISAGMQSVAIIAANGAPAKALVIGKEVAPGVTVSEVHARYVMLSDGGVMKRIDLAADTKPPAAMGAPGAAVAPPGAALAPAPLPAPEAAVEAEAAHPDTTPRDEPQPAPAIPTPPPSNAPAVPSAANPPLSPGAVQQLPAPAPAPAPAAAPGTAPGTAPGMAPGMAPGTAPAQMPAPVRSPGSPVTQPPSSR